MTDPTPARPMPGFQADLRPPLFHPAGTRAEQEAANDAAWAMLAPVALDHGRSRAVISAPWLRRKGCAAAPLPPYPDAEALAVIAAGLRRLGVQALLGVVAMPGAERPSAAFRMAADGLGMLGSMAAHQGWDCMLFPPAGRCALVGEYSEGLTLAGPPALLRAALPQPAATQRAFEDDLAGDASGDMPWMLALAAHYRPFLLDEARATAPTPVRK